MVRNEQVKGVFCNMGRVIGLLKGSAGSTRAARIKVNSNKGKKVLQRSLKHLVPLEICSQNSQRSQLAQTAQPAPAAQPTQAAQ